MRLRYFLIACLVIVMAAVLPYPSLFPPPRSPEFDFDISTITSNLVLSHNAYRTGCVVNVTLTRGSPHPVSLTLSGLPDSYLNYSFNPNSGLPPFTSTLVITTEVSIPLGLYNLAITGTGGGRIHSIQVTLGIHW